MKYLFILGREPQLSLVELEALFGSSNVQRLAPSIALVSSDIEPNLARIGGSIKCARVLEEKLTDYLFSLPDGKITLGFSDYSAKANAKNTWKLAMKYKSLLARHGRSVRLVPNKDSATISSATAHHNQLGNKPNRVEIILYGDYIATSVGVQNITAYAHRDQARPARDAFVGMLPPKLAQILINLATSGAKSGVLLDPFCGTGVVLQEAMLDSYSVYGTDLSEKMIDYTRRNLNWLINKTPRLQKSTAPSYFVESGDATDHQWQHQKIDYVASEIYLGHPLSNPPAEIKLKSLKSDAKTLLLAFLRNISPQITSGTTLALAIPAWLRPNGRYSTLDILDEIQKLDYNTTKYKYAAPSDLLYYRENQIVARQIIVLRKK